MFLVFTLLLIALGVGLMLNVYSAFFPFWENMGRVNDYNVAYYSALSAVERGELVAKYKFPGFDGSGGVMPGSSPWGPTSDGDTFLANNSSQGNWREIRSKTTTIPVEGEGNVDPLLQASGSIDYNALRYHTLETLILSTDETTLPEEYYTGTASPSFYAGGRFTGELRLPPQVFYAFSDSPLCGNTNTSSLNCDFDGDQVADDVIVNRKFLGNYDGHIFSILPNIDVFYNANNRYVNELYDTAIRADFFNNDGINTTSLALDVNNFSLFSVRSAPNHHIVVSPDEMFLGGKTFDELLSTPASYTGIQLSLGLVSLLRSVGGSIYPYLEYQFTFPQPVADRFYKIIGHGRNRDYDVQIQVRKPTIEGTVGGEFTVIF